MSALDDYMSKDDNTWEEYEAALAELAQLRETEHRLHLANDELAAIQEKVSAVYIKDILPNLDALRAKDVSVEKEDYILTGKVDLLMGNDGKLELLDFKTAERPSNSPAV